MMLLWFSVLDCIRIVVIGFLFLLSFVLIMMFLVGVLIGVFSFSILVCSSMFLSRLLIFVFVFVDIGMNGELLLYFFGMMFFVISFCLM